MGLQAYLDRSPRRLLHRPVRRRHAPQHDRHPARHRADAERGQHQPGRVRAFQRQRRPAWSSRVFTICITVAEAALGLAHRHPALPHPPDGDGGSPRSAQGMMTDPGTLALIALLLPAVGVPGPGDRRAASALGPAGGVLLDPVRRRLARLPRSLAWRGHADGAGHATGLGRGCRRDGRPLADVGVLADGDSTLMLMPRGARRVPRAGLLARLSAATSRRRRSAATTPISRCSRSR